MVVACAASAAAQAQDGQLVVGKARFTVITEQLIRMEYDPDGRFVDAPSYFAWDRTQRLRTAKIAQRERAVTIDTGVITLRYTDDGQPFSTKNLTAELRGGARFSPLAPNVDNLGGAARTLDFWTGAGPLDDGILSRSGHYVLDDSRGHVFDKTWIKPRASREQDLYLFGYGRDYKAALASLAAIGGAVPLPRKVALGVWYSRYWPYSSDELLGVADEYAAHDFPLDVMVLDMDWHLAGWTGWSWNKKLIPDPTALLRALHQRGLATTLNLHPADGVGPHETTYANFMRVLKKDPKSRQTLPFDAADQAYMDALFTQVLDPLTQAGSDFFWVDWQQTPFTRSMPQLANLPWLNELFFRYTARAGERGQAFSRWGGFGDHRHPLHFSGDASTTFEMLAFEVPFTAASSNSALFYWTHDIGGHMGPRSDEAYARWCQFGALSAALRSHSSRASDLDRRPWTYADWAERSMNVSFQLRATLFPYIYSSAWQAFDSALPLVRAMYIDQPALEPAYHQPQQYAFGDVLLVAPITEPGAGPRRLGRQVVWFPPGTYYDYFTGERFSGPGERLVASTLDELPLYVRAGVPLPQQPFTQHPASAPTTELVVRCYPGKSGQRGSFTLHEDDGKTTAYVRGEYASTELTCTRKGDEISVRVDAVQGSFRGQPRERSYAVEIPATQRASAVRVDGQASELEYDAAQGINRVRVTARTLDQAVSVQVRAKLLSDDELRKRAFVRRTGAAGGGDMAALVNNAWAAAASDDEKLAVLAAAGAGAFAKNEQLYGYPSHVRFRSYQQPWARPEIAVDQSWRDDVRAIEEAHVRFAGSDIARTAQGALDFDHPLADLAPLAHATFSSQESPNTGGIADRRLGSGAPGGVGEWSADRETVGASVTLTWDTPQKINHMLLFDRSNERDQITAGRITFSNGSVVDVGELPNTPSEGPRKLYFADRTVTWAKFQVTAVSQTTEHAGLAEWAVYAGP